MQMIAGVTKAGEFPGSSFDHLRTFATSFGEDSWGSISPRLHTTLEGMGLGWGFGETAGASVGPEGYALLGIHTGDAAHRQVRAYLYQ